MSIDYNGSVTTPKGFSASGITCGLKKIGAPDLALIFCECPCTCAGAFTSNLFAAAPVVWDKKIVESGRMVQAVVINSGIANACTGEQGYQDVAAMARQVADRLHLDSPENVLVSSTGRIGVQMPMDIISGGIDKAVQALSADGGIAASKAIITTDTHEKHASAAVTIHGQTVHIGGMTKGAGMIAPQLKTADGKHATMLAYFTTDAAITRDALTACLDASIDSSFNHIIVDGDTSTNDTVIALASGLAGNGVIQMGTPEWKAFHEAFRDVAEYLAKEMVMDGEGASKFVTLDISGLATDSDARKVAEAIARSPLCKTAWFGCDPNWGRILAAAGYSGVSFDSHAATMYYDEVPVVRHGMAAETTEEEQASIMKQRAFTIHLSLGTAQGRCLLWTSDLSHDYVTINADYHT